MNRSHHALQSAWVRGTKCGHMFGLSSNSLFARGASKIPLLNLLVAGLPAIIASGYLVACVGADDKKAASECEDGAEGCACFGNKTCLDDLVCLSHLCVDPDGPDEADESDAAADAESPSKGNGKADGSTPAKDEAESANEPNADDAKGDDDESSDVGNAGANETEPTGADDETAEPAADDPGTEPAEPPADTLDDDPTSDTAGDPTLPNSDTGADDETSTVPPDGTVDTTTDVPPLEEPAVCSEGTGSCADGSAMDCEAGQWAPADCSACSVLSCGLACCGGVWSLVADTFPFAKRDEAQVSFVTSSLQATVTATFGSVRQFASVGFTFDTAIAIDPASVYFVAAVTGTVAVELSLERDETTGCLYDTDGSQLIAENICWGDWELTGYGGSVNSLLVRIQSEGVVQTASLGVSSVSFVSL